MALRGQSRPRLWTKSGPTVAVGDPFLGKCRRGWSSRARAGPHLTIRVNRPTAEGEFVHREGGLWPWAEFPSAIVPVGRGLSIACVASHGWRAPFLVRVPLQAVCMSPRAGISSSATFCSTLAPGYCCLPRRCIVRLAGFKSPHFSAGCLPADMLMVKPCRCNLCPKNVSQRIK